DHNVGPVEISMDQPRRNMKAARMVSDICLHVVDVLANAISSERKITQTDEQALTEGSECRRIFASKRRRGGRLAVGLKAVNPLKNTADLCPNLRAETPRAQLLARHLA